MGLTPEGGALTLGSSQIGAVIHSQPGTRGMPGAGTPILVGNRHRSTPSLSQEELKPMHSDPS